MRAVRLVGWGEKRKNKEGEHKKSLATAHWTSMERGGGGGLQQRITQIRLIADGGEGVSRRRQGENGWRRGGGVCVPF